MHENRRTWSAIGLAVVTDRTAWLRLAGLLVCCLTAMTACGNGGEPGIPAQAMSGSQAQIQTGVEVPQSQSADASERELGVAVGDHLVEESLQAGLAVWLERSEDTTIHALPERALGSSGLSYGHSEQSPTDEVLWIHVFTDESKGAATDWVNYVGSNPEQLVKDITPHQTVFDVRVLSLSQVGDASVSIQVFRGNDVLCIYSLLMVFAQDGVIFFLYNSMEITSSVDNSAPSGNESGIRDYCDVAVAETRLTDVDGIAADLSEQLSSDLSDNARTDR